MASPSTTSSAPHPPATHVSTCARSPATAWPCCPWPAAPAASRPTSWWSQPTAAEGIPTPDPRGLRI